MFCADINIVAAAAVASEINKLPGTSVATELYIDVSKEESVVAAFKKVRELSRTKRIDYFVNAAGVSHPPQTQPCYDCILICIV